MFTHFYISVLRYFPKNVGSNTTRAYTYAYAFVLDRPTGLFFVHTSVLRWIIVCRAFKIHVLYVDKNSFLRRST